MASTSYMGEALERASGEVAATNPSAAMLVWEDAKGELHMRTIPQSMTLVRGFLERIYVAMNAADSMDEAALEAEA